MFSIKNSFLAFLALILIGCAPSALVLTGCTPLDTTRINYPSTVLELDNHGSVIKQWDPVSGTLTIDQNTDELTFKDSATGNAVTLDDSYRIIIKK